MHGTTEGTGLVAPLLAVQRGHNIAPDSWSPLEHQTSHLLARTDTGKSVLMSVAAARFRAEAARVARARVLLFTHSYEDAVTQLAHLALAQAQPNGLLRPQRTALSLPAAPSVEQAAIRGFDSDVQSAWAGLTPADLVQRAGRLRRQGRDAGARVLSIRIVHSALIVIDEADVDVSDIVRLVRVAEFRRLDKIERRIRVALRRLAEVARIPVPVGACALSRAVSIMRLPLTGARTLTAPPLAS